METTSDEGEVQVRKIEFRRNIWVSLAAVGVPVTSSLG